MNAPGQGLVLAGHPWHGRRIRLVAGVVGGIDWIGSGWWAGCVVGSVGFAGRERELSSLRAALGGDARLLLVTGDAGVGKTRVVGEAMRRARGGGVGLRFGGGRPPAREPARA